MPRWVWFMPLGVLVLALGVWGFRLGWIAATISETDVIEGYTARYIEAHGAQARATDCVGRPGREAPVWIIVICTGSDHQRVEYPVDRLGRLLTIDPATSSTTVPET